MTPKNVLCAYNGSDTAAESLRYAIKITKHYHGWLTGIARHGKPALEARFSAHLSKDVIDAMNQSDADLLASIGKRFAFEADAAGLSDRSEFVEVADNEDMALGALARTYDLVVTGVPSDDMSAAHLAAHPDLVALHSGRPVIVVPDTGVDDGLATRALVAWDGGRSAARAVGDAMSVLEDQSIVSILCVGAKTPVGTDRLLRNLDKHGINAELKVVRQNGTVAQTIVQSAEAAQTQLIVMGAYERSKFSHNMFGGPTTDVMRQSKVPVFLSH